MKYIYFPVLLGFCFLWMKELEIHGILMVFQFTNIQAKYRGNRCSSSVVSRVTHSVSDSQTADFATLKGEISFNYLQLKVICSFRTKRAKLALSGFSIPPTGLRASPAKS